MAIVAYFTYSAYETPRSESRARELHSVTSTFRGLESGCMSDSVGDSDEFMEVDLPDLAVTDVLIITVNVSCNRHLHSGSPIRLA